MPQQVPNNRQFNVVDCGKQKTAGTSVVPQVSSCMCPASFLKKQMSSEKKGMRQGHEGGLSFSELAANYTKILKLIANR